MDFYPFGNATTALAHYKFEIWDRSLKNQQFHESDKKARDLADAQHTIEEFLRQERNEQQLDHKRKKNGDLE